MLLYSRRSEQLATLAGQVRAAEEATPEMLSRIVVEICQRLSVPSEAAKASKLHKLVESGGLTESALMLIELELPQWKLRRVTYDEGVWHCAMSRQRELPEWLDQAVEANHASLTLAIVSVYIETLRQDEASKSQGGRRFRRYELNSTSSFAVKILPNLRWGHLECGPIISRPVIADAVNLKFTFQATHLGVGDSVDHIFQEAIESAHGAMHGLSVPPAS